MILFLDDDNHFLVIHKNMTLEKFLINAKVREKSYMGRVLKEIYQALTVPKINLVEEYNDYYSAEYCTFDDFLYKKYPALTRAQIIKISKILESDDHSIFRGYFKRLNCYNVQILFDADGFLEMILSFLKCDGNEDQN